MTKWEVYDVREPGDRHPRNPSPFKGHKVPQVFEVRLRGSRASCGCTEWLELVFKGSGVVMQKHYDSGCPRHESCDLGPLPDDEIKELETKILDFLQGRRNEYLRPTNERLIGFYTHYDGDENKFPERAVLVRDGKVVKVISGTTGNEHFDRTIWCGYCLKEGEPCGFWATGEGVPRCLAE